LPCSEKKRKRTSIAAPEKTELEEQFKLQSRPTGKIFLNFFIKS